MARHRSTLAPWGLLALALLAGLWILADHSRSTSSSTPEGAESASVVRVIDGDTLDVNTAAGGTQRIRVLGINTPEIRHGNSGSDQCGGPEATQKLKEALPEGATIRLVTDSRADDHDRYDRALRYIETSDGNDVGGQLIRDGYAYPWKPASDPAPDRYAAYQDAAHEAQDADAGSWERCTAFNHSK